MPAPITSKLVWDELQRQVFAVLSFVNPKGEARCAGIVYIVADRKLWIGTGIDSWKAKHIAKNPHVAVTVCIPKRIPFLPWIKIPAATITFNGRGRVVTAADAPPGMQEAIFRGMDVDDDFKAQHVLIEVTPERDFVTYGVGVSLMTMRRPEDASGRAPVAG